MNSLSTLQEQLYKSLEKEKINLNDIDIQNSPVSEVMLGISFLVFMIYGIYKGSIFVLGTFPDKSWIMTILLFTAMIVAVFIVSAILSVIIEKLVSFFAKDQSLRLIKEISNICSHECAKKGMFTLSQISTKHPLNQLDTDILKLVLEDLVKKGDFEKIRLDKNQVLYKCLLESAKNNIRVVFHESP